MASLDQVLREVQTCPEPLWDKILEFVRVLKGGDSIGRRDHLNAAESALRKDWNTPQEDEAWRHL